MKLFAQIEANGNMHGLIATAEGETTVMLSQGDGVKVYEIADHGIKGDEITLDKLEQLLKENTVHVTGEKGKLVRGK